MLLRMGPIRRDRTNNTIRVTQSRTRCLLTTTKMCKVKGTTNNSRSNAARTSWIRQKTLPVCKKCKINSYNNNNKCRWKRSFRCNRRQLINKNCKSNSNKWLCSSNRIQLMIVVREMLVPVPTSLNIVEKTTLKLMRSNSLLTSSK